MIFLPYVVGLWLYIWLSRPHVFFERGCLFVRVIYVGIISHVLLAAYISLYYHEQPNAVDNVLCIIYDEPPYVVGAVRGTWLYVLTTYLHVKFIILFTYLNHHHFFQISRVRGYGTFSIHASILRCGICYRKLVHLQLNDRAGSTVRKYRAAWLAAELAVLVIPAQAIHVALFVTELEQTAKETWGFSA